MQNSGEDAATKAILFEIVFSAMLTNLGLRHPSERQGQPAKIRDSALVAQLDRVPGFEPGGSGFESLRARHFVRIDGCCRCLDLCSLIRQKCPEVDAFIQNLTTLDRVTTITASNLRSTTPDSFYPIHPAVTRRLRQSISTVYRRLVLSLFRLYLTKVCRLPGNQIPASNQRLTDKSLPLRTLLKGNFLYSLVAS